MEVADKARTSIREVEPGAILEQPVYHRGRTLYSQGKVLTRDILDELVELKIESVIIRDQEPRLGDDTQPSPISEELRELAVSTVQSVYEDFRNFDRRHANQIKSVSTRLISEVQQATKLGIVVHDLRDYSNYTYRHSVNVTAISVATGIRLGLNEKELNELTIGGLLHDIGKMKISNEILNKEGPLTPEELSIMRQHPNWGWDVLREQSGFSPVVWSVARQHHETLDGRGYPDGLSGDKIHEFSRIVAIVDIWDALRSKRPYKPAWNPDKILTFLNGPQMVTKYDPNIMEIFSSLVVPYPLGSRIMVTGGKTAIVVGMNLGNYSRPIIRFEKEKTGTFVDLTESRHLNVIETLRLGGEELESEHEPKIEELS